MDAGPPDITSIYWILNILILWHDMLVSSRYYKKLVCFSTILIVVLVDNNLRTELC